MTTDLSWHARAACRDHDPNLWFPTSRIADPYAPARAVCRRCPVVTICRDNALVDEAGFDVDSRHGMLGGLTPAERADAGRGSRRCERCGQLYSASHGRRRYCAADCAIAAQRDVKHASRQRRTGARLAEEVA